MWRASRWLLAIVSSGCVLGQPGASGGDDDDPPPPPDPIATPTGVVLEPAQGALVTGEPSLTWLRVAGTHDTANQQLAVQLLANPDDLGSWQTAATTRASTPRPGSTRFAFATEIRASAVQWPRTGVLRLRVIDDAGHALPYDGAVADDTVIVVANPAGLPDGWSYLTEKPAGSIDETIAYYAAIDAPPTLDAFMTRYGFPGDETVAKYYNTGDLGIGREMHCRATTGGGLACYVRNFGSFGGSRDEAIDQLVAGTAPLATVAMVYTPPITAPNAVSFMVYGATNALVNEAQLDTQGNNKSVPQNCLNCHGGRSRYVVATHAVEGARFLPFDPAAFQYPTQPGLTFAAQEDSFRALDRLVAAAAPTAGVRELIEGMFPITNAPYDPHFVPAGWNATPRDARVYRDAIAPFCRSCHVAFEQAGTTDPLAFATAESLRTRAASLLTRICGTGPLGMPAAEATTKQFFDSGARAVLLQWLDAPGACVPPRRD